jgi:hypothetical protein
MAQKSKKTNISKQATTADLVRKCHRKNKLKILCHAAVLLLVKMLAQFGLIVVFTAII